MGKTYRFSKDDPKRKTRNKKRDSKWKQSRNKKREFINSEDSDKS